MYRKGTTDEGHLRFVGRVYLQAVCTHVFAIWRPEVNISCLPQLLFILSFLSQGLSRTPEFTNFSGWLASEP